MVKAYKNFWSLNTDEAVVTGILRDYFKKKTEVFMPLNAQMKDIDLILMNIKNRKTITIQIKGSRAYQPKLKETEEYGEGNFGWFNFHKNKIENSTADYFIFLVYVLNKDAGRINIEPHTITIPTKELSRLAKDKKKPNKNGFYHFDFWINPKEKRAWETRDKKLYGSINVSEYLDKKGFERLKAILE
ncbi:MAG: hypothetical protein AABX28_02890 [Nanoarchaeota archaeon]